MSIYPVTKSAPTRQMRAIRWRVRRQFAAILALVALITGVIALALTSEPSAPAQPQPPATDSATAPAYPPCQAVGGPILC